MKYTIGELVYVWRQMSADRWQLVPAHVHRRHRDGTTTVNFNTPTGRWSNPGGGVGGYELRHGARLTNEGIHGSDVDASKAAPIAYQRVEI